MKRSHFAPLALLGLLGCGARTDPGATLAPPPDADAAPEAAIVDSGVDATPDVVVDAPAETAPETSFGECQTDGDCALHWTCDVLRCVDHACVTAGKSRCDDGDPCTADGCDPAGATCTHAPVTLDADGDGHRAALPGTQPGAPGACGDDCDDTRASVHPGAREVCNAVDDDCNGLVDDGVSYVADGAETSIAPAGALDSLATATTSFTGGFAVLIAHHSPGASFTRAAMAQLDPAFARTVGDLDLGAQFGREAFGMGIAWAGDRFGVSWVHSVSAGDGWASRFALVDTSNRYRGPGDVALFEPGMWDAIGTFWTGYDFLVPAFVINSSSTSAFGLDLHAAHVSAVAVPGADLALPGAVDVQSPVLSMRPDGGYLITWNEFDPTSMIPAGHLRVAPLDESLTKLGTVRSPIGALVNFESPTAMVGNRAYVAATTLDGSLNVVAFDPDTGQIAAKTMPFVGSASIARDPSVTPLGARVLVSWADDHDDGSTFEVYTQVYDLALAPVGAPQRISHAVGNSRRPLLAAIGGTPDAVVIWDDARNGAKPQAYARKLLCAAP
jgi:hypothetical protein